MMLFRTSAGIGARWTGFVLAAAAAVSWASAANAESHWLSHTAAGCGIECGDPGCGDLTGPISSQPIYSPSDTPIQDSPAFSQTPSQPPSFQTPATTPNIFSGGVEGTLTAQSHAPGYIDWAMPRTQFRMRFDAGFDNVTPDRAEFFYAQCGCSPTGPGPGGPGAINGSVDNQDIRAYLELASGNRFSVFGEVPVRFIQGEGPADGSANGTGSTSGLGDIEVGFKYALSTDPSHFVTFQLRGYLPTGDADRGLGTQNVNIEPGILFQSRVNSRVTVFGELRDWIPINGSNSADGRDFAGNVLRYGLGVGVTGYENSSVKISPITELVGWSVLDGLVNEAELTAPLGLGGGEPSAQTTIVNAKFGLRTQFKHDGSTLYVGYGRALTGTHWYEDIIRVDYTIYF